MNFKIDSLEIRSTKSYKRQGEPKKNHDKLYFSIKGETVFENLVNRRSRPHDVYKKELIPVVLEKIKNEHPNVYEKIKDIKWGWNQNCGCSMCPCSGGFIGDKRNIDDNVLDITVTITD